LSGPGLPVIEVPASIDLGEQEIGRTCLSEIPIYNKGTAELVVDHIRTNCACTGLEDKVNEQFVRLTAFRLTPGQSKTFVVRMAVQGQPGAQMQNFLTFHTNDPEHSEVVIPITVAKLRGSCLPVPTTVLFGTVSLGNSVSRVINVYDAGVSRRTIREVASTVPRRFGVRLLKSTSLSGEDQANQPASAGQLIGQIEVMVKGNEEGSLNGEVLIYLAGQELAPDIVPVLGRVASPIEVTPLSLVLPRRSGAGLVSYGECICRSIADEPVALTVQSIPQGVSVKISEVDGNPRFQKIRIDWQGKTLGSMTKQSHKEVFLRALCGSIKKDINISVICQGGDE